MSTHQQRDGVVGTDVRYLVVPGWTGSGPDHWQTHLERSYRGFSRVEQADWDVVERDEWVAALDRAVRGITRPVVLVGHSCGSVTIAQWAAQADTAGVVAALLVAPADVEAPTAPTATRGQAPLPSGRLPMRTHVVVADDDPYLDLARAHRLARSWGSTIETMTGGGHLATADGYGPWPRAATLLEQLTGIPLLPR